MAKIKVLLIDDERDFVEIMSARIESWGYEVITALNAEEGIDILKLKKPDIIILDYMMPKMDGLATLKEIRAINNEVPVIMFTAHPDMKSARVAEKLKITSYVPKLSAYSDTESSLKEVIRMAEKKLSRKEQGDD